MKPVLSLLVLAGLAACRNDDIEVRHVAKEGTPPAFAQDGGESAPPRGLRWMTPAGWTEHAGSGMRAATFELPQEAGRAEVTVVALPGDVGGELANVNRWRGQIALAPLSEAQLAGARARVRSRAGAVAVYDFTSGGQVKTRIVAAWVKVSGTTWFFKLMGEEKAAAAAKPAFLKLLEGLKSDEA